MLYDRNIVDRSLGEHCFVFGLNKLIFQEDRGEGTVLINTVHTYINLHIRS